MNLHSLLSKHEDAGKCIRVGVIGVGKFATMFLSQILRTPGMRLTCIYDLDLDRARANLITAGFDAELFCDAPNAEENSVLMTDDFTQLLDWECVDVVVESTGDPLAGTLHARYCIMLGIHVVMVNVEADVLVGPALCEEAKERGVVYSLAYGDQPALIAEMVDMVRAMGFDVVCAGKGTKYLPSYHDSTPETVWHHYGLTKEQAAQGGMNSKMFNSFLDGTKSAIEMAAVANATGLGVPESGLKFPPCSVDDLAEVLKPKSEGGVLDGKAVVEVISSLNRDGTQIERDLRWGVYTVFEAPTDYVRRCFREYGLSTDSSGKYACLYRPFHLIGLELGVSVASVALRGEPTGAPKSFVADTVCVAKKDLQPGDILDGEGGETVWGRLTSAKNSVANQSLPIGLASGLSVRNPIAKGAVVSHEDVELAGAEAVVALRQQMQLGWN